MSFRAHRFFANKPNSKFWYGTSALAAMILSLGVTAEAAVDEGYSGGKARVNQSAKLRVYSEEIAAASCRLAAGIDAEYAKEDLARARTNIASILNGLRDGNPSMGIPSAEQFSTNLKSIERVSNVWAEMDEASATLLNGSANGAGMRTVSASYPEMFESTSILASDMSGKYSDPAELLQSDAIALNFVSRQAVLLARMERIVCGMATGNSALGTADDLAQTVELFDISLSALRDGMPDAGIQAPPSEAVAASLEMIEGKWSKDKYLLMDAISDGGDAAVVKDVAAVTRSLVKDIANTTTLYLIATPGQEGVYRLPVSAYVEDELSGWLANDALIGAIKTQNDAHAQLSEDDIISYDNDWREQAKNGGGPLINQLLEHEVSKWLRDRQLGTAGLITEVFIMDNKGLNVAQSVETSDYWQGDEAKWKETYGTDGGGLHIAEIEFDDSTGFYQTQASMPIFDPQTNEKIGAVTFGINVQGLM